METNSIGNIGPVTNGEVLSVEKGNINKADAGTRVIAFTISHPTGAKIKLLLKNNKAKIAWDMFLRDGKTKTTTIDRDGIVLHKEVLVSFESAKIREVRSNKEIVCQDPVNLSFSFNYVLK